MFHLLDCFPKNQTNHNERGIPATEIAEWAPWEKRSRHLWQTSAAPFSKTSLHAFLRKPVSASWDSWPWAPESSHNATPGWRELVVGPELLCNAIEKNSPMPVYVFIRVETLIKIPTWKTMSTLVGRLRKQGVNWECYRSRQTSRL